MVTGPSLEVAEVIGAKAVKKMIAQVIPKPIEATNPIVEESKEVLPSKPPKGMFSPISKMTSKTLQTSFKQRVTSPNLKDHSTRAAVKDVKRNLEDLFAFVCCNPPTQIKELSQYG